MTSFPKISIVTPSFNQGRFIEKTILSVIEQDYPNLEYIIIDGGSTDESVEIIRKYEKHLAYWVSEPDRGQSHAINKGFEHATGEIFGWLNSDDWYHPGALKAVAEAFAANPEAGAVVGAGDFYSEENNSTLTIEPFPVTLQSLYGAVDRFFMQPSCFFTNAAWKECGPLDEYLHLAMDLDLWLKIATKHKYAVIDTNLSVSLVHQSAKTTALAAQSLVDASLVIMRHGGEKEGRQRLVDFVQELYDTRQALETLEADKSQLIRINHEIQRAVQSREQKIYALENSLSWRITSPLRRLGSKFSVHASQRHPKDTDLGSSISLDEMSKLLSKCPKSKSTILLLDFTLGGGSNLYSRNLIGNMEGAGYRVILLEYRYNLKDYHIEFHAGDRVAHTCISSEFSEFFQEILKLFSVDFISVSQLVSWPETEKVFASIRDSHLPYIVFIHDYFMICPNYNVFDFNEKFCRIPDDPTVCNNCLPAIVGLDIPFEHYTNKVQIETWRKNASEYLAGAERVICFSETSVKLVKKAYPALDNLIINEHYIPDQQQFRWKQRSYDASNRLTIAVIGGISVAKGSKFLDRLIHTQEFLNMPVTIVLVGEINPPPRQLIGQNLKFVIHGSYIRADLGRILEHYDVSIVMIPSLWPETFCYTASEAILLGYPVLCFDLGAQAERVKRYNCGWVVQEPYLDGTLAVLNEILCKPEVVQEKSILAKSYIPPSVEQHFSFMNAIWRRS